MVWAPIHVWSFIFRSGKSIGNKILFVSERFSDSLEPSNITKSYHTTNLTSGIYWREKDSRMAASVLMSTSSELIPRWCFESISWAAEVSREELSRVGIDGMCPGTGGISHPEPCASGHVGRGPSTTINVVRRLFGGGWRPLMEEFCHSVPQGKYIQPFLFQERL